MINRIIAFIFFVTVVASYDDGKSLQTYKKLFLSKRAMHMEAVENIKKLNFEKRGQMIKILLEKLFVIMEGNIQSVVGSGFQPGDNFPEDQKLREAYAIILENTIFFGDLVLRFPDHVHRIYDPLKRWKLVLQQSLNFLNTSQVLSENDQKGINLAAQELNIIERSSNFQNPYSLEFEKEVQGKITEEAKRLMEEDAKRKKNKKKRKKRKREPRLSDEL